MSSTGQQNQENETDVDILRIEKRYDFERKELSIHKYFEWLMVLFLLAGLLGLFGDGILSKKKAVSDTFEIDYHHLLRAGTSTELYVQLSGNGNPTEVSFNHDYLDKVKITDASPQPLSVRTEDDRLIYTFDTAGSSRIVFYLWAYRPGTADLELGLKGEVQYLSQYIFI